MKSDVCKICQDKSSLECILNETEKAGKYSSLDKKQLLRLRLLAEELNGMLGELLEFTDGEFWVESEGKSFELHVSLVPNERLNADMREKLLAVSTSGKNAAASGIMAKIKLAAQFMLIDYAHNTEITAPFYTYGLEDNSAFQAVAWSLAVYRIKAGSERDEKWDELEKSIIANIADDVIVGLKGRHVDITVKKHF